MTLRNITTALAVVGIAVAPVAAQAGTRASDTQVANVAVGSQVASRSTKSVKKDQDLGPNSTIGVILVIGLLGGIACLAFCGGDNEPNVTNGS